MCESISAAPIPMAWRSHPVWRPPGTWLTLKKRAPTPPTTTSRRPPIEARSADTRPGFQGPVVEFIGPLTISAGETFTQALMGRTPHITRIGENTQGVFSDVLGRRLPNGWSFALPNEVYRTPEGTAFDEPAFRPTSRCPSSPTPMWRRQRRDWRRRSKYSVRRNRSRCFSPNTSRPGRRPQYAPEKLKRTPTIRRSAAACPWRPLAAPCCRCLAAISAAATGQDWGKPRLRTDPPGRGSPITLKPHLNCPYGAGPRVRSSLAEFEAHRRAPILTHQRPQFGGTPAETTFPQPTSGSEGAIAAAVVHRWNSAAGMRERSQRAAGRSRCIPRGADYSL